MPKYTAAAKRLISSGAFVASIGLQPFTNFLQLGNVQFNNFELAISAELEVPLLESVLGFYSLLKASQKLDSFYEEMVAKAEEWEGLSAEEKKKIVFKRSAAELGYEIPETQQEDIPPIGEGSQIGLAAMQGMEGEAAGR